MRTILFLVVSLMIPMGVWFSGCGQDATATAPMPKGPEMERLARSPAASVEDAVARPPTVPALIDPEILATPDQPTFERIRTVMDREAVLLSRSSEPGLFVLPRQDYPEMAIVPDNQRQPHVMDSFWSRPVNNAMPVMNSAPYPTDISAMAPAAPMMGSPRPASHVSTMPALTPLAPMPEIPGMYFGPDEIAPVQVQPIASPRYEPLPMPVPVPAQTPAAQQIEPLPMPVPVTLSMQKPAPPIPDLFGNTDLGLLAPLAALDDLAGVMAKNAQKAGLVTERENPTLAAQKPAAMEKIDSLFPLPNAIQSERKKEEMASTGENKGYLDISSLLEQMNKPDNAEFASTEKQTKSLGDFSFGGVDVPELLKADASSAVHRDGKGSPFQSLDPVMDYDFSSLSRKDKPAESKTNAATIFPTEKPAARKLVVNPVNEPIAPPLFD